MKKIITHAILIISLLLVLGGCVKNETAGTAIANNNNKPSNNYSPPLVEFSGEKGVALEINNGAVKINESDINGQIAKYYNTVLPGGKTVYFFVVKDKDGIYRAAGNACQVCADAKMGFKQVGDFMVCNTCGNQYPLEKIATEKGGCNPVPISPNLSAKNGKIIINQSDIMKIADFF